MRSPKQKFIESPFKKGFEDISQKPEFEEALYAAFLEFQLEVPEPTDPSKSWDAGSRLAGARRYMQILSSLHVREEQPVRSQFKNLKPPQ